MRVLVTGANGQLGNEMQVLAKENPQHTYFFTDVQELDICDEQAVQACIAENQIDVVVNCAAYTAVDKAEDNEELCRKLNQEAPGILARAAQAHGAAMIQVSRIMFLMEQRIYLIKKIANPVLILFTALPSWGEKRKLCRIVRKRW